MNFDDFIFSSNKLPENKVQISAVHEMLFASERFDFVKKKEILHVTCSFPIVTQLQNYVGKRDSNRVPWEGDTQFTCMPKSHNVMTTFKLS